MAGPAGLGLFCGPGTAPNRYRLREAVGGGGEGEVYRAELDVEAKPLLVAVKVYRPAPGETPERFADLATLWEGQLHLVQSLRHPSIVRMRESFIGAAPHHDGETAGGVALYLVMDWVDGATLTEWSGDHLSRTHRDINRILSGLGAGLAYMHSGRDTGGQPILHRDVKPENVLVTDDGQVVLVDFGLSHGQSRTAPRQGGTPGYLAPEAIHGAYSTGSDLYALAGLMFYLLTGQHPRPDPAWVRSTLRSAPLAKARPDTADVVVAGLEPEPRVRPSDVAEWVNRFRTVTGTTMIPTSAEDTDRDDPGPVVGEPVKYRRGALAALVMAVAAVAVAGLLFRPWARDETAAVNRAGLQSSGSSTTDSSRTVASTASSALPATTTMAPTTTTIARTTVTTAPPVATYLGDLKTVGEGWGYFEPTVTTMNGEDFQQSVVLTPVYCYQDHYAEWNLGRGYRRLTATVGMPDWSVAKAVYDYRILVDGRTVHQGAVRLGELQQLDVDVSNGLRLRIEVTGRDGCYDNGSDSGTGFGSARLER